MSSANDNGSASVIAPEFVQGSPEWYAARCGKITASCFGKLAGEGKKGGWSQKSMTYIAQVLAERISGVPSVEIHSKYLDHGHKYEPIARQLYQWHLPTRQVLKQIGFIDHPAVKHCGGSPDCLVGDDGVLEIKCPYTIHTHLLNIENDGTKDLDYQWQMQGNVWVTGRKWCDFVSFHPFVPDDVRFHVVRYHRDNDLIEEIEDRVTRALDQIAVRAKNILSKVRISASE